MATTVFDARRTSSFTLLRSVYARTGGSEVALAYIPELAQDLDLPELDVEVIALRLADEGLLRIRRRHILSLTWLGVAEVRAALPSAAAAPQQGAASAPIRSTAGIPEEAAGDAPDAELAQICAAIGLDPKEIAGSFRPPRESAAGARDFGNGDSDELLKLIESAALSLERLVSPPATPLLPLVPVISSSAAPVQAFRPGDLADLLASLKLRLLKLRFAADDMAEAEAEIATAIAQLHSPRPKLAIVASSVRTLLALIESAGGLPADIEESLIRLRAFLRQLPG